MVYRNNMVYYQGRVIDCEMSKTTIQIICDSLYSTLRTATVNAEYTINCIHRIYDAGCTLNPTAWQTSFSISGVSNRQFTIPINSSTTDYTGGFCGINLQSRQILKHSGTSITLDYIFKGTQTGTMTLTRGCNLTPANCQAFGNYNNFLGLGFRPVKDPFSETGAL
jgi:hypothetical protein